MEPKSAHWDRFWSRRLTRRRLLRTTAVSAAGLAALALVGCGDDDEATDGSVGGIGDKTVHWSYEGESGPEKWGRLSYAFATCASGREQSPVDIPADATVNSSGLSIDYQTSALNILNNGHTIQANYDPGSEIGIGGKTYQLLQFHFHIPSEHTLERVRSDMELHLVHRSDDEALAVIGVLLREGEENAALADVWANLPEEEAEERTIEDATVRAEELLPDARDYFKLDGSLTTPPCTEAVTWLVMREPRDISREQIDAFAAIFPLNARPVQPLNDRTFEEAS